MATTKQKIKHRVQATNPPYVALEKALFKFMDEEGWKSLTAFLVNWTNRNQPDDTNYSLPWWLKESFKDTPVWAEICKYNGDSEKIVNLIKEYK